MRRRPLLFPGLLATAMVLAVATTACGDEERPPVTVFAAASLADVLQPLGDRFTEEYGSEVRFSFGGSTTLAQQIVRGAPTDVFISAGKGPMDHVESARLVASGSRANLLGNELALVGPSGAAAPVAAPNDLLREDVTRVAIADPSLAPAGEYAQRALQNLDLWEPLQPNLVFGPDVRTALQFAASGNVDASIVYATDAAAAEGVDVLWRFPADAHPPIVYPVAALTSAVNPGGAAAFIGFLHSEEAQAVFRRHGFPAP